MVGDDALKLSSDLELFHPIKNGIVENWDELSHLLENVFDCEKLKINPKRSKIFLTESPGNSKENREKMIQMMFEKFDFHSVFIGNQAAMSLFGQGLTSGVVVQLYEDVTDISPVHFYPIKDLCKRFPSTDNESISENIFNTIQAADSKIQLELFKRIVLLGSSSINVKSVEDKIRKLYLENVLKNDEEKLKKFKLRVDSFPADNDQSFNGGAVLARINQDAPEFWISKTDYFEDRLSLKKV